MRIDLRDENRSPIGRVHVDPAVRPTRVVTESNGTRLSALPKADSRKPSAPTEVFLTWDTALDDAGQLRRCVACGCTDLFREKAFPQVTVIVVILAFIGAIIGTFGLATDLPVLLLMIGVLVLDVAILVLSRRRLVCYQCRTTYHDLPIARYHRDWDRSKADRYPGRPETADVRRRGAASAEKTENRPASATSAPLR